MKKSNQVWYKSPEIVFFEKTQQHPFFDGYYDTADVDILSLKLPDSTDWSSFALNYGTKLFIRYKTDSSKIHIDIFFSTKELIKIVEEGRYLSFGIDEKYLWEAIERGEFKYQSFCSAWICNRDYFGKDNPPTLTHHFDAPEDVIISKIFDKPENETIFAFYMLPIW